MNIVLRTDRMNITFDTWEKRITVTQFWYFIFTVHIFNWILPEFTYEQKEHFKDETQRLIRKLWDNKVKIKLMGTTNPELIPFIYKEFSVRIDLREVSMEDAAHWKVYVEHLPSGDRHRAGQVCWERRRIDLTTEATSNAEIILWNGRPSTQRVVAHEFGHAFGADEDEYEENSPHVEDINSIMNIGHEVRKRHYTYLRRLLEAGIPGTLFLVKDS